MPSWIKLLAVSCLFTWLVVMSLVNLLDKKTPPKLSTADSRWSRLSAAQADLERTVNRLDNTNLDRARRLVDVYVQQNQFAQAEKLSERILDIAGNNSFSDIRMTARVERQKGDYETAIKQLEKLVEIEKADEKNLVRDEINLGTLYYLNGLAQEKPENRKRNFLAAQSYLNIAQKTEYGSTNLALKENLRLTQRELKSL